MLTEQDFISAGYKRYNEVHKGSDYLLQKRIDDEHGKKYFIDVYVYDWRKYRYQNPTMPDFSFNPEVQFRAFKGGNMTMNVSLIVNSESTIEQIEKEFEDMWVYLGEPYYEGWNAYS